MITSFRRIASAMFVTLATVVALGQGAPPAGTPPSPVPAAVAIARPSEAEVDAVRRSFADFRGKADAATQALLQKYPNLLEVRPPGPNSAVIPFLAPQFQAKHDANLAVAKQGDAELLLVGDSITDFWRNEQGPFAGKAVLEKYFGKWKVANFGIAGDTTQGVLYRLQHGEGQGIKPRAIMMMIGTNNTARNSAAEIAEGIGAVVAELRKDFPEAKILLLGVFPRGRPNDPVRGTIAEINRIIGRLEDNQKVFYMDIGRVFLDGAGVIATDIMSDGLHPSAKGYELWARAVVSPLTALMEGRMPLDASRRGPIFPNDPRVQEKTYHFADTNEELPYALFVSSKVKKNQKAPLVVMLHGLGVNHMFMPRDQALELAEQGGYILVAPMGFNIRGWYGAPVQLRAPPGAAPPTGQPGRAPAGGAPPTNDPPNLRELSEKDAMNVLALVRKEYSIDDQRIYLMGHSMGGAGTLHLATKYPRIWAAVAAMAPAAFGMDPQTVAKAPKVPFMLVHGGKDTLVPADLSKGYADALKARRMTYEFVELPDADHGSVIPQGVPKIFAFFDQYSKGGRKR
jgi:lysophospholipase L1-like esterase/dienelactone hydrolase